MSELFGEGEMKSGVACALRSICVVNGAQVAGLDCGHVCRDQARAGEGKNGFHAANRIDKPLVRHHKIFHLYQVYFIHYVICGFLMIIEQMWNGMT
jgi:hypothetical protein